MSNQDGLIDFIKDPKNIAKAVEGSMDKRNKAMDKITIDEIFNDRLFSGAALTLSKREELKKALLEQLLGLMPEKKKLRKYNPDKDLTESHHTQIMVQNMSHNQALSEVESILKEYLK